MNFTTIKETVHSSPAFLLDETAVASALENLSRLNRESGCRILFSIKSLPLSAVLQWAKPYVHGFSVSSLFEARLAEEILKGSGDLHLTTPGIRDDEIHELAQRCSHISFNSMTQFERYSANLAENCSIGMRINPQLSFLNDARYDPCRKHSKLGIPLTGLEKGLPDAVQGLHFHTMFAGSTFEPLIKIVERIEFFLGNKLNKLDWINLGGGYLFQSGNDHDFINLVKILKRKYSVDVFIEPGNAVIGEAGDLLTTVIDIFSSDGKKIAVLDTSINHNPEVFEYQKKPDLMEENQQGDYSFILAGSTCLAGDLFGEYRFKKPLEVGDRLIFKNVGAYSLIKANRFNGYNLPDIYTFDSLQIKKIKCYSYQQYRDQWMAD